MDILGREDVHHFLQNILKEVVCCHTTRTEVHLLVRLVCARQFGISRHHLSRVTRHLYLGHDGYAAFSSVSNEIAQLVLCVIAAVSAFRTFFDVACAVLRPFLPCALRTPCRQLGEPRIALYLDAPSGSVGEMDVQAVELILRHYVHLLLDEFNRLEMTRHVEHQRAPLICRSVVNVAADNASLRGKLTDSLPSIAESVSSGSTYKECVGSDMQAVSLRR